MKVYVDGKLAPIKVLLDELNQTFQTKEPLRIGAGGGAGSRFVGAIDEPSVYAAALDAGDIQVLATKESITEILRIPSARRTDGPGAEAPRLFPGDRCSGLGPRAVRASPLGAGGDRRAGREHSHDDGHGGAAGPAPTHVLFRGQYDQLGPRVEPGIPACLSAGTARDGQSGWIWPAGWSIRQTR